METNSAPPPPSEEKLEYSKEFETDTKNIPLTYKKQASALRKGDYVILKDRPCVIVEMCTSK